ncbi:MAG: protein-L-isoaspartate O-methyltransferase, partial [Parcubacteria group bacterium]|nr:protein-L-isoaspartate O-methyltransferase [Parcubacteria group bacterium]
DVGTGSGWQAALLAEIVEPQGSVVSIERIKSLSDSARENLAKFRFGNFKLVVGDGSRGYQEEALYDRIIAAASAGSIPQAWRDQLKPGGVIVAPVGGSLVKLTKVSAGKFKEENYPGFAFVPLIVDADSR